MSEKRARASARRSDAGWSLPEIDSQAERSFVGASWRWREPPIAIRPSTDEGRARPALASARVGALLDGGGKTGRDVGEARARQRAAQRRGLVSARDRFPGREVLRRRVVEM